MMQEPLLTLVQSAALQQERSGSEAPLPACDAIYVNAGATAPLDVG